MTINETFEARFDISAEICSGFIDLFNDRNPLHTQAGYAVKKGFKGIVIPGNVLNGFLSHFVGECLPLKNVIIHSQSITYRKPVYLDDKLLLHVTVADIHHSVNAVIFSYYFENQTGLKVASGKIQIGIL